MMEKHSDQKIIESWKKNIDPWVKAIRDGEVESRVLVTNNAIIEAIRDKKPASVLDLGCGEGWLVRALEKSKIPTLGLDVVPEFIEFASQEGAGRFMTVPYEDLATQLTHEKFDIVACNFSLLGDKIVEKIFQSIPALLNQRGLLIVQTIHPKFCEPGLYEDGWREGSWKGFSHKFSDPAPWYFRTLETWKSLFFHYGFELTEILEPLNPKTQKPASVIFVGELS